MQARYLEKSAKYNTVGDFISAVDHSQINTSGYSKINFSLLCSESDFYIAIIPATRRFNLTKFNKILDRPSCALINSGTGRLKISLVNKLIKQKQFSNNIHVYLDEKLECQDELYLIDELSKDAYLIAINQLKELLNKELIGISFSDEIGQGMESQDKISFKERVKALHSLPPMPETASQILKLRSVPDVKIEQIVNVIERDPVLAAQIVRYANSAYFGQAGSVKSLKDAIFRVLGVDAVMNMALALSVGSSFKIPSGGPIGAKSVWKSSIYTASLMQRLSMLMPWGQRPNPGTAYLIGLLHDFGLFVLGHLFSDEYLSLNNYLEMNPGVNIIQAEQHILGISHFEIGKIVMRMWNMPVELIEVTKNESNAGYSGEYNTYIQLLTVVKSILAPHGLVYGNALAELPQNVLELLSLDEEGVIIAADEVLQAGEIMKDLVKQMCA